MNLVPSTIAIDHAAFDRLLESELVEVVADLDADDRMLLHMEMAAVARSTAAAIESGDSATVQRHFTFMEKVFLVAAPDVENAIHVSYLENIFLGEERPQYLRARQSLPPRLARGLQELEEHFEKLAAFVRSRNGEPL